MRRECEFRWLYHWYRDVYEYNGDNVVLQCVASKEEQQRLKYSTWTGEPEMPHNQTRYQFRKHR